jgi:hypothetical protein
MQFKAGKVSICADIFVTSSVFDCQLSSWADTINQFENHRPKLILRCTESDLSIAADICIPYK